ncbi:MAG: Magnesium transporter MgtE [candidate division TA06 bacterium ADurb.Bin131]|uniref:Magnesium transporter MgtE n=1 Tax=candidate division TA06 bacterium ADurb.Bin131 TaxID=1852827 RepID=A0A1V6C7E0_UNCT6|nr:MAG: Magnesium transporter MgtE [candidate division TA06 bacterium ADurb.Bin131]
MTEKNSSSSSYRFLYFSNLAGSRICAGGIRNKIGKLTDLVVKLVEPYPETVGLYIEHGWGRPTEFVPWEKVKKIENRIIFIDPPPEEKYPPFVDQPGWIMIDRHLMGKTILDIDGRRIEVVNDVHLMEAGKKLLVVHVDISFNGFLRKCGLGRLKISEPKLISWRYVQPLSVEDAISTDTVSLSITKEQFKKMPGEDLADVLEILPKKEQEAVFSALDSEKAAEALVQAEPRTQRQIVSALRKEKAKLILSELSIPQIVDLFSILPYDDIVELTNLLPPEKAEKVKNLLSQEESTARELASNNFIAVKSDITVGDILKQIRSGSFEHDQITYIYVVTDEHVLIGVIDIRQVILARDDTRITEIMTSPVVSIDEDLLREDICELFAKYNFRMLPVVDKKDVLLGVIHYKDVMKPSV